MYYNEIPLNLLLTGKLSNYWIKNDNAYIREQDMFLLPKVLKSESKEKNNADNLRNTFALKYAVVCSKAHFKSGTDCLFKGAENVNSATIKS